MGIFKNTSYKTRNKIILMGTPGLVFILWFTVFFRTADLYFENSSLQRKIEKAANAPEKIAILSKRLKQANSLFGAYSSDSLRNREQLLHVVSDFCRKNNIVLKDFPQINLEENQDIKLETNLIVAEGNFHNLLRLLYELEQVKQLGRPSSASFHKTYDNKRKKDVLSISIYLQNITVKKENENI